MTLSGKDLCMIEHMQHLIDQGLQYFHVQNLGESAAYAGTVGAIYRREIDRIVASRQTAEAMEPGIQTLAAQAKMGLCNGYYFESSGQDYIGRP